MKFNTIERETKLVIRNNELRPILLLHMLITKDANLAHHFAVEYFHRILEGNPTFALKLKGIVEED